MVTPYPKPTKPKTKKKKPKNERKKLIKQLDEVVRQICRKRDTHCSACGKKLGNNAQLSHFISRRVYKLRWDLRNCSMSCPGCNLRHNYDCQPYASFLIKKYGVEILQEFRDIKNSVNKMTTPTLRELLKELCLNK